MKRALLLLPLLLASLLAEAIHWRGDYDRALDEGRSKDRPLLLLLVLGDPESVRTMLHRLMRDETLSRWIDRRTVPVLLQAEGRISYPIELYYTTRFPTLFLVDSRRELPLTAPCLGIGACLESLRQWRKEFP
ncbi:hypothetical protein [Nitratifractor sp.]